MQVNLHGSPCIPGIFVLVIERTRNLS